MASITKTDIKGYARQRQAAAIAAGTVNKELGMLCAACNHACDELGWNVPNPAARKKLQEPEGRVRWLEQAEAVRLIQSAAGIARAPWLVDFVQLALNTGCRVGELLRLEWARVDLRANLAILNPGNTKNGKRRSVPLNESAREAMLSRARYRAEHCPASPWVFCRKDRRRLTTVKRSFKAALKLAGIDDFRIHDQRHAFAVFLLSENVTLPEIRDTLGHSTIKK